MKVQSLLYVFKGFFFFFLHLAVLHGLWDLSSLNMDGTQALGSERAES